MRTSPGVYRREVSLSFNGRRLLLTLTPNGTAPAAVFGAA